LSLPDEYQRVRVEVAGAAAALDPDRAEAIARSLDGYQQAQALGEVAKAVTEIDPDRARRCLAEALTGDSWMEVLPAVVRLEPQAVIRAVDALAI